MLGQAVASQTKVEQLKEEAPGTIVDIVRLLLSCLHAWNLDERLDAQCERVLGLVRPCKPVSFGLLSKGNCLSLVLPGWGREFRLDLNRKIGVKNQMSAKVFRPPLIVPWIQRGKFLAQTHSRQLCPSLIRSTTSGGSCPARSRPSTCSPWSPSQTLS